MVHPQNNYSNTFCKKISFPSNLDLTHSHSLLSVDYPPKLSRNCFQDMVLQCINNNKRCNATLKVEENISQKNGMCYSFVQNDFVPASGSTYGLQVSIELCKFECLSFNQPFSFKSW